VESSQKKLAGKVAIVTGAGSSGPGLGIGKAISVLCAREGAKVVLVDKFEDRAKETLSMIESEGGTAAIVTADLADIASGQRVVDAAVACYGGVDILINNAAMAWSKGIHETPPDVCQQILAINLMTPIMLCKAAIPVMIKRGGGSIVNISSTTALRAQGGRGSTVYASSKAGLYGLMVDLAGAWGKEGIRVNTVAPGIVSTPMQQQSIRQAGLDPAKLDLSVRTSLGYVGDAWDIARATVFLAGPDGRFITGVLIPVDGGSTAGA
jgi:NAD(P)-dependent dehydrogenase (short-subunit alcohol dehydrogenase family)